MKKEYPIIDTVESLREEIDRVKKAQAIYAAYTQEKVDEAVEMIRALNPTASIVTTPAQTLAA